MPIAPASLDLIAAHIEPKCPEPLTCGCGHGLSTHAPRRLGNPPEGYTYTICRACACEWFRNAAGQEFRQGGLV
jgi:hypothetical protein